jgi:transcriptional regulator with XRE-family HTH domain
MERGDEMVLMRRELGDVLREERRAQKRSLRDVSAAAAVSLGYLSEIERGEKEASSELLGAICDALGLPLSALLRELSTRVALAEGFTTPVVLPVSSLGDVSASAA